MSAGTAWFVSIVGFLGLVIALHGLGFNAGATLATMLRGAMRVLGEPLAWAY